MKRRDSALIYIGIVAAIVIVINLLSSSLFTRFDITDDGRYSLSEATKEIVSDLPEVVTITAYFTEDLPPQYTVARTEFKDLLIEYVNASKGEVVYEFIDPSKSEELEREAVQSGIQPLVINIREKDKVKQQKAYMGAVIKLRDKTEIIPFIQPGGAYEYAISSAIKKLSVEKKPWIGLVAGQGEVSITDIAQAYRDLSVLYNVEEVYVDTADLSKYQTLAIVRPTTSFSETTLHKLNGYIASGKSVLVAFDRVSGDFATAQGKEQNTGISQWLAEYDINVAPSFIVDASCGAIAVSRQQMGINFRQNIQFPYFPRTKTLGEHVITEGLKQIQFQFASPISYSGDTTRTFLPIVTSSNHSGLLTPPVTFDINKQWQEQDFPLSGQIIAGVLVTKGGDEGKIVVISDGEFAVNTVQGQQQQLNPENVGLLVNSIDFLSDDTGLIELRSKSITSRPLGEVTEAKKVFIKWFTFLLPIVLVLIYGIIRAQQRKIRRLRRRQPSVL